MKRKFGGLLVGLASTVLLLSACSPTPGGAEVLSIKKGDASSSRPSFPGPSTMGDNASVVDENTIELTLYGSSSCPPTPSSAHFYLAGYEQIVDVHLDRTEHMNRVCTMDYMPHTYTLVSLSGKFDSSTQVRLSMDLVGNVPDYQQIYPQEPYPEDPNQPVEPGTPTLPVEPPIVEEDPKQNPDQPDSDKPDNPDAPVEIPGQDGGGDVGHPGEGEPLPLEDQEPVDTDSTLYKG